MTTITAANADLLNQMGQQAMAAPLPAAPVLPEISYDLPDTEVSLPGGFFGENGFVTEAEVRELTGHDEEALAKAPNGGRLLLMILERGTVRIGDEKATKKILDDVLMGDREMLLLAIAKATFGNEVDVRAACPSCMTTGDYTIDLTKDVPVIRLEDPNDRFFTVNCRKGPVKVALPVGSTHRTLLTSTDKSGPELNSLMLGDCLMEVNGVPAMGVSTAKGLGWKDRGLIEEEIAKRNPGPRLDKITKTCTSCGGDIAIPLTTANLFRI